ncbi:hypothetical protein AgCh_037275 [Apium graveolens]
MASVYYINFLLILIGVLLFMCNQVVADSHSEVKFLPGFTGPLPFNLQTGYVGVDESEDVQLFYYFIESERNPKQDPLILWMTGGPGCSSFSALANEIGPIYFKEEVYNGTLPTLLLNPNSWTKIASIIFLDLPVGTGFSYGRTSIASSSNDSQACAQAVQFLRKWLLSHREFLSNPFYVAGDSYAGIFVPIVTQLISNENEAAIEPSINLKGYLAGNPVTSIADANFSIIFSHGMGIISDELYESLKRSCGLDQQKSDSDSAECSQSLEAYEQCTSGLNQYHILEKNCDRDTPELRRSLSDEKRAARSGETSLSALDCPVAARWLFGYWLNDESVQEALHIRKGTIGTWVRCNRVSDHLAYDMLITDVKPYHANLSTKGYRSLIYSGDHDFKVPFQSTQAWIRNLNYSIIDEWRPWIIDDQYAGYTRTYSNNMTFATVKAKDFSALVHIIKTSASFQIRINFAYCFWLLYRIHFSCFQGGGHTAPEYRPAECYVMFERWISGKPL